MRFTLMEQQKEILSQQNVEDIVGTVVYLKFEPDSKKNTGRGSGFFIEPDKIVTNIHVVSDGTIVNVKCQKTGTTYTVKGVIASDDINDLAVLKITESADPFSLGNSRKVRKGHTVCLVSYREEDGNQVDGTVDSIRNSGKHHWIGFNIPNGKGYSGSPVLNAKGEVVSVLQASENQSNEETLTNYRAIASNLLITLLDNAKEVQPLDTWQKQDRIRAYEKSYQGDLSNQHKDIKEAIAFYDDAIRLNPDLADTYHGRAAAMRTVALADEMVSNSLKVLRLNREQFSITCIGVFLSWKWKVSKLGLRNLFFRCGKKILGEDGWAEMQVKAKFHVAKMKIAKGDTSEALQLYQLTVADLTEVLNHKSSKSKQETLNSARKLYQQGINNLTEIINRNPESAESYCSRGIAGNIFGELEDQQRSPDTAQKLYHGAINDFTQAIELKLGGLRVHNLRGQTKSLLAKLETKQGNMETTQKLYQEIVSDSDNALGLKEKCAACRSAIHFTRGAAESALENQDAAIEDYNNALELNPKYVQAYINRGHAKNVLGDTEGAIEDFSNAIRVNPEEGTAYFSRGGTKSKIGDYVGAIEDYSNAIKHNSEPAKLYYIYYTRGNAKLKLDNYEGAITDYDDAIRLHPKHAKTYKNRGKAKQALGQHQAADADFAKAKELDPDFENKFYTLTTTNRQETL